MASNINAELGQAGWNDLGTTERPGLIVLRKTEMPAVLVEVGFLDNPEDNQRFDEHFEHTARAIADGILNTLRTPEGQPEYYQIQVGAYADKDLAQGLLSQLQAAGYPAFLVYQDGLYKVRVGAYLNLDNAAWMEKTLRAAGYSTLLVQGMQRCTDHSGQRHDLHRLSCYTTCFRWLIDLKLVEKDCKKHVDISETICYYKDNKRKRYKRSRETPDQEIRERGGVSKSPEKGGTDHRNELAVFKKVFPTRPERNLTNFI
ncbi:MAG: SPOR domain-containing protein [Clostridium sp.]